MGRHPKYQCPHCKMQVGRMLLMVHKENFLKGGICMLNDKEKRLDQNDTGPMEDCCSAHEDHEDMEVDKESSWLEEGATGKTQSNEDSEFNQLNSEEDEEEPMDEVRNHGLSAEELGEVLEMSDICNPKHKENSKHGRLITWILFFLSWWQASYVISDSALNILLAFFGQIFLILGSFDSFAKDLSSQFPTTIYRLRKWLCLDRHDFQKYIVCGKCLAIHQEGDTKTNGLCLKRDNFGKVCRNQLFHEFIGKGGKGMKKPKHIYCYRPLSDSLEHILQRPDIEQYCSNWKNRDVPSNMYADIYDGKVWKEFADKNNRNFFNQDDTYGLMINVDWFQPFKRRSNISIGVIYVCLLNLPRRLRFQKENMIIAGIIPSLEGEPKSLTTFMQPLVSELKVLWNTGVIMKTYTKPLGTKVRGALICAASDIPAARKLCGYLSHAAKKGCSRCNKTFPGNFGEKRNYSGFERDSWLKRTHEQNVKHLDTIKSAINKTTKSKLESQYGVRYSPLYELPYYNSVRFCIIDPMHNLFLGTAKFMWKLWNEQGLITIKESKIIDQRLLKIVVPISDGWKPKVISSNWGAWTAEEWRSWTLVHSLYCLHDILPDEHLKYWELFIKACGFIAKPTIRSIDVIIADQLFVKFGKRIETLYGRECITPNMHLHCHLMDCIYDYGSIYGFWLFAFERFNGILGALNTNNKSIEEQLMQHFLTHEHLYGLQHNLSGEYADFFSKLIGKEQSGLSPPSHDFEDSLSNCDTIWSLLDNIVVPITHQLKKFDECERRQLLKVYKMLYNSDNWTVGGLSSTAQIYSQVNYDNEAYHSYVASKKRERGLIMACWCQEDGMINEDCLRPGIIKYFVKHSLLINGELKWHVLCYVKWFRQYSGTSSFRPPITVWESKKFVQVGPASFIPVQRISSKFAYVRHAENDSLLVVPMPKRICL